MRIARACSDSGIGSVAVYAEPDRDALHVKVADDMPRRLDARRHLSAAGQAHRDRQGVGADAIHPGYGPRRERAVRPEGPRRRPDLGRPRPAGHRQPRRQGQARHIALKANAPCPRHRWPVNGGRGRGSPRSTACRRDQGRMAAAAAGSKVARDPSRSPSCTSRRSRGGHRLRPRRVLRRALPRQAPARRDPVPGRPARQCRRRLDRDCSLQRRNQSSSRPRALPLRRPERRAAARPRPSSAKAGYVGAGTCSSSSARTARSPSSRSTPGSRSSTR